MRVKELLAVGFVLAAVACDARGASRAWGGAASDPGTKTSASAEQHALDDETTTTMIGALGRLPQRQREVLTMRYYLDLSEAETAELLGIPRGTAKSRLSRALGRLRPSISDDAEARDG